MVDRCRARAKRKGIPCTITKEDVVIPEVCPVLHIPIKRNAGGNAPRPDSPSIDRIVPELGYIPGNVMVISYLANSMKSNATPNQLRRFARWVLGRYGQESD